MTPAWLLSTLLMVVPSVAIAQIRRPVVVPAIRIPAAADKVKIQQLDLCACGESSGGEIWRDGANKETERLRGFFELGVSSLTGANLPNVEYRIYSTTTNFDTGIQTLGSVTTDPGYTNPHASWEFLSGANTFVGVVDPSNRLGESVAQRANNTATMTLTLKVSVYQQVNLDAVGSFDRLFRATLTDPAGVCRAAGPTRWGSAGVKMSLNYVGPQPKPVTFQGCTMIIDLLKGVTLGNGWTVSRVNQDPGPEYHDYTVAAHWDVLPSGASLAGRLNLHFTQVNTTPHNYTLNSLVISGPQGTQPTFNVPAPYIASPH